MATRLDPAQSESARLTRWECPEHGNDAVAYVPPGSAVCRFLTNDGLCGLPPSEVVYVRLDVAREAYVSMRRERDEARA